MQTMEPGIEIDPRYGVFKESRPLVPPRFYFGTPQRAEKYLPRKWWYEAKERSQTEPVKLQERDGRAWWRYRGDVYVGPSHLGLASVQALAEARREGAPSADG